MERIKSDFLLLLSFTFFIVLAGVSCEAPEGPAGAQGPQGEQGPEGPVGPAGEDGSTIHAGTGVPSDDTGAVGDFYLNQSTGELYGPKTESDGWGIPFSLKGEDGQDGTDGTDGEDGSQIYAGPSVPDGSLGSTGDYYLNQSTFDLYGPKTDSGWGTPINLQATANVMYTSWFAPDWNQVDDVRHKRMRITETRLDPAFLESGIVLVYYRNMPSVGNRYDYLLPHTVYFVDGEVSKIYRSYIYGNGIYIDLRSFTQDLDLDDHDADHNVFRYVLVPGSEDISFSASGDGLHVNLNNYLQVKKYYGIRD